MSDLAPTRDALHTVAEHVLAAGQYHSTGSIQLRCVLGGFETARLLDGDRRLGVRVDRLVVSEPGGTREAELTTVAAAAAFAGIEPGMPGSVYPPATPLRPDEPLQIDAGAASTLAAWFELVDEALRRFAAEVGSADEPVLWPEHFDVGIVVDAVNYGGSPGDEHVPEPYLYVGPHAGPPARDDFWNAPFGAARTRSDIADADGAVDFFRQGRRRAGVGGRPSG
jgi:hypothetical protein